MTLKKKLAVLCGTEGLAARLNQLQTAVYTASCDELLQSVDAYIRKKAGSKHSSRVND